VASDVEVQDATSIVADDKEAVEEAKRDGRNCEEVHGGDGLPVVFQEGEPVLSWLGISQSATHPPRDGPFR
jgi:hypothetical protein